MILRTRSACLIIGLALLIPAPLTAARVPPDAPRVSVRVDERVELLSIVFRLAGNREYNMGRVQTYVDDVEAHFGPHRNHPAILAAAQLRQTRGVSYDAVMSMAIHLTDTETLDEVVPFDGDQLQLDSRWTAAGARDFVTKLRDFVKETDFASFVKEHHSLYELATERMQALVDEHADLPWFDSFFGDSPEASFTVAVGLLNGGGNFGPKLIRSDGGESLYAIMGTWLLDEDGLPRFDESVIPTLVHEFCHSYANHLVEEHREGMRASGELIFPVVAQAMRRQAYNNWETMYKESLVRASVVRYMLDHYGQGAAMAQLKEEQSRGFEWTDGLTRLLSDYADNRETWPTLSQFMPKVVAFFDDLAPGFAERAKQRERDLAARRPNVVSISPANGAVNVDPSINRIIITFDRAMQKGNYSVMLGEGGQAHFPEVKNASFDESGTVFTMDVALRPNWTYQFSLNNEGGGSFRSAAGVPLSMVAVAFGTGDGSPMP